MPDVKDFETEITKLNSAIAEKEQVSVVKRSAADKLRDDMLASDVQLRELKPGDEAFDKIDEAYKETDGLNDEVAQMRAVRDRMYGWASKAGPGKGKEPSTRGGGGVDAPRTRETIGRRFIDSEGYERARSSLGNNKVPVNIQGVPILTREELLDGLRTRAGLDLTSGQAAVTPEFQLIPPVELPVRQPRIIDMIDLQTTDTDAVVWLQQTQRVLAAMPTPSGTNAPQETDAFARQTAMVRRIPVLLTVPKEVLADEARLQGILNKQMMEDTRLSAEYQALLGDGTGENFLGILNTSGIGSSAKAGSDYDLDAIHRGITYVRLNLFEDPDGIGQHPTDLEKIMLQKDNYGRYVFDPSAEQTTIWGFPTVATPVFPEGTGVVANWRMAATMWLREDVVITATDGYTDVPSNTNYFSAGLVAILAQIRAAFAVERPFAICEITSE